MARTSLSGRLGRIREAGKRTGRIDTVARSEQHEGETGAVSFLPGWTMTAPYLYERTESVSVVGFRKRFSEYLPLLFPHEREQLVPLASMPDQSEPLVFFDLETTGLSHGAGTVAFMAGIAHFTADSRLEITQLLISDYPGEIAFLERFSQMVGKNPVLVSFNGKCFDSQILATRFLMNGMRAHFLSGNAIHLDLLFPSRRLWKDELGTCRLSAIEQGILGITREDDLPGSEAPDAWFDFVRSGEMSRLLAVGDHNRDDCSSLARLLFALDDAIDGARGRAGLVRALDLRSRHEYEAASRFLAPLAGKGDRTASRLLAIDSEHRLGELERALNLAESLGDAYRAERLRGKIEKQNGI